MTRNELARDFMLYVRYSIDVDQKRTGSLKRKSDIIWSLNSAILDRLFRIDELSVKIHDLRHRYRDTGEERYREQFKALGLEIEGLCESFCDFVFGPLEGN